MSGKKQFGVWMDTHQATIVSNGGKSQGDFSIVAHVEMATGHDNSSEHAGNNHKRAQTSQFFKEIASHMPNADFLHLTGTGQAQEEFANYLAGTAQYKNTVITDSTANKMSDEALLRFFGATLN